MTAEPWLSARELAPRIGVSVTTVRRLGDSLPRTLVGGQWRYLLSEVEEACRERARGRARETRNNVVVLANRRGRAA